MNIPSLDAKGIKRVQDILGALIFYEQAVDNKVLADLNNIDTQQSEAAENTNEFIDHLIDYLATYPNGGIVYRARNMVLSAYSDAGFNNESKIRIQAGTHVFLEEDEPL